MSKVLVTGGTVFVSKYVAQYFVSKGDEVYVLNRNSREQVPGVKLIQANRHNIGEALRRYHFDTVLDITAYTANDVNDLLDALGTYDNYIFLSSSAVYPELVSQPFKEDAPLGINKYWGKYGTDKLEAEEVLMKRVPSAYILRPPYLYGPGDNVYREAFVFDCALQDRKFYLPRDGEMKLQFFHVGDLCRFIDVILKEKPKNHVFNVGNKEALSVREWVKLCYGVVGKKADFISVHKDIEQRRYFSFYDYEYYLDVNKQEALMPTTISLQEGLKESYEHYKQYPEEVNKKPMMEFIDTNLVTST